MSNHTPGPWHVADDGNVDSLFGGIALVWGSDNPDDETMANARLLAAAPELLDALRACIDPLILLGDHIGNTHPGKLGIPAFDRCAVIGAARAAIAKAKP